MEKSNKDLEKLNSKIEKLTNEANAKKSELETKQKEESELSQALLRMTKQLEAAEQLINDLGSEKVRWGEEKNKLV